MPVSAGGSQTCQKISLRLAYNSNSDNTFYMFFNKLHGLYTLYNCTFSENLELIALKIEIL